MIFPSIRALARAYTPIPIRAKWYVPTCFVVVAIFSSLSFFDYFLFVGLFVEFKELLFRCTQHQIMSKFVHKHIHTCRVNCICRKDEKCQLKIVKKPQHEKNVQRMAFLVAFLLCVSQYATHAYMRRLYPYRFDYSKCNVCERARARSSLQFERKHSALCCDVLGFVWDLLCTHIQFDFWVFLFRFLLSFPRLYVYTLGCHAHNKNIGRYCQNIVCPHQMHIHITFIYARKTQHLLFIHPKYQS